MGALRFEMEMFMRARGYSSKTISLYTTCVNVFAHHFNKSPLSISYKQIEAFFLHLRDSNKSESTIHIYYESIKYFYTMHRENDRMPKIVFRRLNNKLPEILSQNEVSDLLSACESLKYRTLFTLVYSAGLRISEVANLRLRDIDYDRKLIFISSGKNKKDRYTILADKTSELLKHYINIFNPENYLFYSNRDISIKISIDSIQKTFNNILRKTSIQKKVHVHTLRHCFATHLLEHGTSIFYIMQLLGHSSIHTTLRYLHMQDLSKLNINSPIDFIGNVSNDTLFDSNFELLLVPA